MKILAIKCDDGRIFISEQKKEGYYNSELPNLLFDGVNPEKSFCEDWYIIYQEPKQVQKKVSQPNINDRYELIEKSMASDKISPVFKKEDVYEGYDDDYNAVWKEGYRHLQSLYRLVSDPQPDKLEDVPFEFVVLISVKDVPTPNNFSYDVQRTQWSHGGLTQITQDNAIYQIVDKLIFPAPLLPQRPCKLSSVDTYKIVRQYIKNNINPKVAEITSDYDFCFTVKKKIELSKPEEYLTDVNWSLFGKRKKPKYETRYRRDRLVEVFEMTNEEDKYKGYTPIKGFEGKTQKDLKEKIDAYLSELIQMINEPLKDCPNCKGLGVMLNVATPQKERR